MRVRIHYGKTLGPLGVDAVFSFISEFGRLQPTLDHDRRMLEYTGVSMEDAESMKAYLEGIENIDISCEREPRDYEPFTLVGYNEDIGVKMTLSREENGDRTMSLIVSTRYVPVEIIGRLTISLDDDKMEDLKRWVHEVTE